MKKRSFVEEMTAFISNMRAKKVEKEEPSDPLNIALIEAMREEVKYWLMYQQNNEEGASIYCRFCKQDLSSFKYKEDLSEELQEEFVKLQPFNMSITRLVVSGVEYPIHWDFDTGWGEELSTKTLCKLNDNSQVVEVSGEVDVVIDGVKYTGTEAAQRVMMLMMTSQNPIVDARFKIGKEYLDLPRPTSNE